MHPDPSILVIDIGKTHKKRILFDGNYNVLREDSIRIPETRDEDGDACEDVHALTRFVQQSIPWAFNNPQVEVQAIQVTTYGASLVLTDEQGEPVCPLYNYLKPFPDSLKQEFYRRHGGEDNLSMETASPSLGSLNSGLQLYRLHYQQPELFRRCKYALHLPQYVSSLLTHAFASDLTSIGCHTLLWDFRRQRYHTWVAQEGLKGLLAPILPSGHVFHANLQGHVIPVGIGLHDSSAALVPYLVSRPSPFVLISTGTWCITLNPFSEVDLTLEELKSDCLCYLGYDGRPVKAARYFAGHEYEIQLQRIAEVFGMPVSEFQGLSYDAAFDQYPSPDRQPGDPVIRDERGLIQSRFRQRNLQDFETGLKAYYRLIQDMVEAQVWSSSRVAELSEPGDLYVDGGFSVNRVFMQVLANRVPHRRVYAAEVPHASALGAALSIHEKWNTKQLPESLVLLRKYTACVPA